MIAVFQFSVNNILSRILVVFFSGLILAGSLLSPASAEATMVSINRPEVNMRSGPGTGYKVLWVLKRGYPLQVIGRQNKWYRVRDFEGDSGWVYAPLTSREGHLVVKKEKINLRSGPGTRYRIVAQARRGVVFRTVKQVKGWAKVRHENGVTAWVARHLVWGW
jgi:SH3-like domain-containing protein